jgi:hypothetical protein
VLLKRKQVFRRLRGFPKCISQVEISHPRSQVSYKPEKGLFPNFRTTLDASQESVAIQRLLEKFRARVFNRVSLSRYYYSKEVVTDLFFASETDPDRIYRHNCRLPSRCVTISRQDIRKPF